MIKRILSVFGANLFGQIITVIIQLISVPMFLHFWGEDLYGGWLVITAIPAFIIISGTGIGFVAGNTMQKYIELRQEREALMVFQSAWMITISLSLILICAILPVLLFTPLVNEVGRIYPGVDVIKTTLILLVIYVILSLQTEFFSSAYRANGKFARSVTILNLLRLAEFAGIMIIIPFGAELIGASFVYIIVRITGIIWMLIELQKFRWINLGFSQVRKNVIKDQLVPTFTFLGFPLGHACLIQGMTTVVGLRFGPSAVVAFSVVRTLTGFIKQFSSTIYYSIWPEFSSTLTTGRLNIAKALHRNAFQITFLFSIFSCIMLYFFGEWIFEIWTGGKILIERSFLLLMLVSSIPNTLWMMSSYVSISINEHSGIALIYSFLAIASMGVAYLLAPFLGLLSIPVAILICDFFTFYFVLTSSFRILHDKTKEFIVYIFSNIPLREVINLRDVRP